MGSASSAVRPREVMVRPASQRPPSTVMAAANPQSRISARSQGSHVGERSSSTYAQSAVTIRPAARVARATMPLRATILFRARHRVTAPMPTNAPIAGASAIV